MKLVWKKTQFQGVVYYENPDRRWKGRADRNFGIRYRLEGKTKNEMAGWLSTGMTPAKANRIRSNLVENIRLGKQPQTLKELKQMVIAVKKAELEAIETARRENITLGDFWEAHYLPWMLNANPKNKDKSRFKTWLNPVFGDKPMSSIAVSDIENLKDKMVEVGKASATVKQILVLLKHMYKLANKWEIYTGKNPVNGVDMPRLNNARMRFLSKEEADKLLEELKTRSILVYNISVMSLYTGARFSEIAGLKYKDITQDMIQILDTKNNESRVVFITEPVQKVLDSLPSGNPDDLLFKNRKGETIQNISKTFYKAVITIGLNDRITDRRQLICFHSLRHTFASWAVSAGVPLYQVGQALGHRDEASTRRYSHLSPDSQRIAFEKVAEI